MSALYKSDSYCSSTLYLIFDGFVNKTHFGKAIKLPATFLNICQGKQLLGESKTQTCIGFSSLLVAARMTVFCFISRSFLPNLNVTPGCSVSV